MSDIKVFGHLNPDTDATCSPIVYAWYLNTIKSTPAKAYVLGEPNKEALFVINRFNLDKPELLTELSEGDKVAILDTNNPEELPSSISNAEIVAIIDHHKLVGGLTTESPIEITMSPIACTATLVWHKVKESGAAITADMAGTLLACILSDTLKFSSPTTTDIDRQAASELAEISGQDVDALAAEMFEAKSDLTGMSNEDILTVDSKIFEFGSKKARVSVLETTKPSNAISMANELRQSMSSMKANEGVDLMFFFVVDILTTSSELMVENATEEEYAKQAFGGEFVNGLMHLEGVVSRKKQMVPKLEAVIK